jgi:hypothetical protein
MRVLFSIKESYSFRCLLLISSPQRPSFPLAYICMIFLYVYMFTRSLLSSFFFSLNVAALPRRAQLQHSKAFCCARIHLFHNKTVLYSMRMSLLNNKTPLTRNKPLQKWGKNIVEKRKKRKSKTCVVGFLLLLL